MPAHKVFVVYDDAGTIKATAAPTDPHSKVIARGGHHIHEMSHPGSSGDELMKFLIDLHRSHKVRTTGDSPVIVRERD